MRFRERLRYEEAEGAIYDGSIRYMKIRPDALMGIFARLAPAERKAALEALGESVREHGRHSAQTYVEGDPAALYRTIEATAPDLGWGLWNFADDAGDLTLTVRHSPFVAGARFEGPVCHAIAGMAGSVGEIVRGEPCTAHEVACAADGAPACTFRIVPAAA